LDKRATMVFDGPESKVVQDPDRDTRVLLSGYPPSR